jgi:hypothetical protein
MTLTAELERAWSEALASVDCGDPHENLRVRWSVAPKALTTAVSEREARYVTSDKDVRLDHWPPTPEEIVGLEVEPTSREDKRTQLEQAQILVLELLIKSMGEFAEAMAELSDGANGRVLWEAGAFAIIRDRAALALRITRELDAVDAMELESDRVSDEELIRARAFEALHTGRRALLHSDPEAALLHCLRAARARLASFAPEGNSALDFSSLPEPNRSVLPVKMLTLAEEVIGREVDGRPINAGVSLMLAHALLPRVGQLVVDPSVEELIELLRDWPAPERGTQ